MTEKNEENGNLDGVILQTKGIFNDDSGTVIWKEVGDSKQMQFLESECGTEYVTSSRGIAREVIWMAKDLPIH